MKSLPGISAYGIPHLRIRRMLKVRGLRLHGSDLVSTAPGTHLSAGILPIFDGSAHEGRQQGFTLLELLISITLIAILVVVLSMALRSGIDAYTRSKAYNQFYLPETAIYGLLWRQLEAVPDSSSDRNLASFSRFSGRRDGLTFITTYVPQGTAQGGLFQVAYLYDSRDGSLIYAQKVLTSGNDVEREIPAELTRQDIKELSEEGWLTDKIENVEKFSFSYQPSRADMETGPNDWDERYEKKSHPPREIAFKIRFKGQDEKQGSWHVIPVGIQ